MPTNPTPVTNLEQQHKLAKDLIRAAREGDPAALARVRAVRSDATAWPRSLKLADAQLAISREAGFDSWPKLVADLEQRDVQTFCDAVREGDVSKTQRLLESMHVRRRINDPMFAFGQRAAHIAATNERLLTTLIAAGADVNMKSEWENGPYTVLDRADDHTARFLLAHGARLTPNVAARLGWFDELRALVDADGTLVHARGGDGQQPLHEAKTVAIADFLLDRGADVNVPLHRSQVHAGAVRAGRSPGCLPPTARARGHTRHLHGRPSRRHGDGDATPGHRSFLRHRSHQRGRLSACSPLAHLLLDARFRDVSARRRGQIRSSRRP